MRGLTAAAATALLAAGCASAPPAGQTDSAPAFAEGVYRFGGSWQRSSPTDRFLLGRDGVPSRIRSQPAQFSTAYGARLRGVVEFHPDGSISVESSNAACSEPSPARWDEERVKRLSVNCGDVNYVLHRERGVGSTTIHYKVNGRGECIMYRRDDQGRPTSICEEYGITSVRESRQVDVPVRVWKVDVGA